MGRVPPLARAPIRAALAALRRWDRAAGRRAGHLGVHLAARAARVRRVYGREARVVYPPVRTGFFRPVEPERRRRRVPRACRRSTPYKRVDVAVDACTRLGRRLVVIGTGPEARAPPAGAPAPRCASSAGSPTRRVRQAVARCRAFLFPGEEEFGIAPLEAMAAGRPVIAYGAGRARPRRSSTG